jgi:uncharacterized protein YbjT (DUF2867 family)
MNTILITGAAGNIGSAVIGELQARAEPVRAFVRDPARADAVLGDGVERAVGDFADPASIRAALDGVDRVMLCSPNHPEQAKYETNVIDAAVDAGVRRVVKIGANGAQIGSPLEFWDAHGRIERHLRESGLPSVVLHPSSYTSNLLAAAESIRHMDRLFAPAGEAKVTLIDPRDVAAVAAVTLVEDGHDGRTYTLTGPEAVTYHEAAVQLSAAIGRQVTYVNVPDAAARDAMLQAGLLEWLADQLVILWAQLRRGAASTTTDVVRVLTGREPRAVAEFARDFDRRCHRGDAAAGAYWHSVPVRIVSRRCSPSSGCALSMRRRESRIRGVTVFRARSVRSPSRRLRPSVR